jgi:hypothetical protein
MDLIFDLKMKAMLIKDYLITDELIQDIENKKFKVPEKFSGFQSP